jgi:hypothetical protein
MVMEAVVMQPSARSKLTLAMDIFIGLALALLVMALARSVQPALIGLYNDDSNYMLFGKALATGQGYVNLHIPGNPPAARFPIGFPAILAAVMYGAGSVQAEVQRVLWVPIAFTGMFMASCYWYYRAHARLPAWIALMVALCLPFTFVAFQLSYSIMADIPFAALCVVCIAWMERVWRREGGEAAWKSWLAIGLFIGLICLVRYAGGTLLMALALTCLAAWRWKPLVASTVGFGLVFGAWQLFRAMTGGGESYISEYGQRLPDVAALIVALREATTPLLANSLPGLFVPHLAFGTTLTGLLAGCLIATLILFGTLRWFRSPRPGETPLAAAYIIVSLPLVLLWQLSFLYLGSDLLSRLLIPVAPFLFLAFGRGVQEAVALVTRRALPWKTLATLALIPVLWSHFSNLHGIMQSTPARDRIYFGEGAQEVLSWLETNTPRDALLASWNPGLITYYTGRKCVEVDVVAGSDPVKFLTMILRERPTHVVGWPVMRKTKAKKLSDATVVLINAFQQEVPEVLDPVFVSKDSRYVVFKVDYPTLNKHIADAKAAKSRNAEPSAPAQR